MRIVFIEPASSELHVYKGMPLPRLGIIYLATILKKAGHDVTVYAEDIKAPDPSVLARADVVGISTITATAPRAYEYARMLGGLGITTIMGGPHVTFLPEEALEYCEIVAVGEAENSILPLIEALEGKRDLSSVPGIAYLQDGKMVKTPPAVPVMDLDELPSPDFTLLKGGLPKVFFNRIVPVMTSRGCPYNCNFCSVTEMFGHKYRSRSPERILEDIKKAISAVPGENDFHIFFYDDHFVANRKRTRRLMELLIEEGLTFSSSAQVRVELGRDPELLKLMRKAGLDTVYVGFESVNPETLKAYNKGQSVEDIEQAIKAFHKAGIHVHGMFVFGSDEDTADTVAETTHFAKRNKIESVQYLVLTPLPGTGFYRKLEEEKRLATHYWALFDGHHVTYEPKKMTPYELQVNVFAGMRDFYGLWDCLKPLIKFRLFEAGVKFYGRKLVKMWTVSHGRYLSELQESWHKALQDLEKECRRRLSELGGLKSVLSSTNSR